MILICMISLLCLKICSCKIANVNFDLNEDKIMKFPWVVAITDGTSLIAYGTLIHKKAVLTRAFIEPDPKKIEQLKVNADCFFLGTEATENNYNCSKVQQVSEYNIIEQHQDNYNKNLAILILTNSFKLSERVNVIELNQDERQIFAIDCVVVSLKTVRNINSEIGFARFFSKLYITELRNRTYIQPLIPLQSHQGSESYDINNTETEIERFIGSPLVCASLVPRNSYYMLIGITNIIMKRIPYSFQFFGDVIRIDGKNAHVQKILEEIIRVSYLPKKNVNVQFATFFSLTQAMILGNRTNIGLYTALHSSNLCLYNAMGEESYVEYENSYFELHYPGSPLVCKSTQQNTFKYVLVGVVNLTYKKHEKRRNNFIDIQSSGEIVRIDESKIDMKQLFNKIMDFV